MKNIVLLGMPGAGKSTVGVLLAKTLKRPFLDTDLLIQTQEDRFLQEIIDQDGMDAFLDCEARTICSVQVHGHVIATGGSVVYRDDAMTHLRAHGVTLLLPLPFAEVARRIHNIATRGIAKQAGQSLEELYHERQPLYLHYADLILDASNLTVEETVSQTVRLITAWTATHPMLCCPLQTAI